MAKFSLSRAIREKEQPKEIPAGVHPLIVKKMRQKGERDAPSKRRTFLSNRYKSDIGGGDAGADVVAEPSVRSGVSRDIEPLL
jgi:hypothetical protein